MDSVLTGLTAILGVSVPTVANTLLARAAWLMSDVVGVEMIMIHGLEDAFQEILTHLTVDSALLYFQQMEALYGLTQHVLM